MKVVKQSWRWLRDPNGGDMLRLIEEAGRTCYKSEEYVTTDSHRTFAKKMIDSGHHAMIEFAVPPPVKVITDRGVTHEIVRHRLFSYAQESTRYCRYKDGITVILPVWMHDEGEYAEHNYPHMYWLWRHAMQNAEKTYIQMLDDGWSPQQARSVLPNSLKTEINICGNVREWRHFFTLRCSNKAHPQMSELARDMLAGFRRAIPVLFDDIAY